MCKKGDKCKDLHPEGLEGSLKQECKFFKEGKCDKGDKCPFIHTKKEEVKQKIFKQVEPKETAVVFTNSSDFIYFDFKTDSWAFGDVYAPGGALLEYFPENCSVVKTTSECQHSRMIVTGGLLNQGFILNWCFGLAFKEDEEGNLALEMSYSDSNMLMPEPRMMHESVILKNGKGESMLVVIGGKTGPTPATSNYSNSVIGMPLKEFNEAVSETCKWQILEPMICARANFGWQVINNQVFVFGGISSKQGHLPQLANPLCEKYDPITNTWQAVEIEGASPLAAFGWTVHEEKLLIVGGTDGEMLQENCWSIDFKAGKASLINSMDIQIAMSKVFTRGNTIYSLGGYGSGGLDYTCKLGQDWEEFKHQHASLNMGISDQERELANMAAVFF